MSLVAGMKICWSHVKKVSKMRYRSIYMPLVGEVQVE